MKKTIFAVSAVLALISLGACNEGNVKSIGNNPKADEDVVYTGVLPAADTDGIRYTLHLDYDDDEGNMSGDYNLVESYLVPDSTARMNYSDSTSFKTEGDFVVMNGTDANTGKKYIKLTPDKKSVNGEILYFLVDSDSTLTLTNAYLQTAEPSGLNYTIKRVK